MKLYISPSERAEFFWTFSQQSIFRGESSSSLWDFPCFSCGYINSCLVQTREEFTHVRDMVWSVEYMFRPITTCPIHLPHIFLLTSSSFCRTIIYNPLLILPNILLFLVDWHYQTNLVISFRFTPHYIITLCLFNYALYCLLLILPQLFSPLSLLPKTLLLTTAASPHTRNVCCANWNAVVCPEIENNHDSRTRISGFNLTFSVWKGTDPVPEMQSLYSYYNLNTMRYTKVIKSITLNMIDDSQYLILTPWCRVLLEKLTGL